MEETQLLEKAPAEINGQPLDDVDQLQKDWPLLIEKRQGSEKLLSGIAVWHDFDWQEVIGHHKTIFPNCKGFAAHLRIEGHNKEPVLFLTIRDEVKTKIVENTRYRILVANVNGVRSADSYTDFLANVLNVPLTELIANENLLLAIDARAKQDSKFAAAARSIFRKTGTGKVDRQANVQEALRRLEDCEGIEPDELTQLLTLLTKRSGTTLPIDSVLDSLADEQDVLRWARANQVRWQALLREVFRVKPGACSPTISDISEYLRALGTLDGEKELQVLRSLHVSGSGVKRFLAEHMPLIRELAESEYKESDLVAVKYRQEQLNVFNSLLHDPSFFGQMQDEWGKRRPEDVWQHFFETNQWIFGYGLRYVFMTGLNDRKLEQVTTGHQFDQPGKRVDALMRTRGVLSSLCLVEIKTHKAPLLRKDFYRPGCWQASLELTGSIAQTQQSVARLLMTEKRKVQIPDKGGNPTNEVLWFNAPKSFVVIGNLSEFNTDLGANEDKFSSFELFRNELHRPEIITFDELYERARYIVEHAASNTGDRISRGQAQRSPTNGIDYDLKAVRRPDEAQTQ